MFHQLSSPLVNFTTPDMSISLNKRSLSKNKPACETGGLAGIADPGANASSRGHSRQGAKKIDKKPVSSKSTSH
jgi:hypothetical protein